MNINKSYIRQCFKTESIQLTKGAEEGIVRELRIQVSKMPLRCKDGNVKRLTSELLYIALGKLSEWKGGK